MTVKRVLIAWLLSLAAVSALVPVLSLADVAWSVLSDYGSRWLVGAAVAAAVQLMALASSGRGRDDASGMLEG
ncbi:hypothetical protein [Glycomyces xiaoerkulensis]|uniref:hypothetical protein n=1 Tax=Glycomyces xiaoerkulensis TaxID=2038139 RepID=UPI0013000242|nr:hypothetical protein [Glycomyces xiaoerkulensis]